MKIHPGFVGIDISKDWLDLFDGSIGRPERIPNTDDAVAARLEGWRSQGAFVLFEATAPYDRPLRRALVEAGVAHARPNPARVRAFARALGTLAKTDAVDARVHAAMAQALRPDAEEPDDPEREALASLHRRRDDLVAMRAEERNRRQGADRPDSLDSIERHIAWLDHEIDILEARIRNAIETSARLAGAARLLRSIPGIGPVAATTLLALMPELGRRNPKAIAALAALAPLNHDSGQRRGQRAIRGGRRRVRQALYMAAVSAARASGRFAQTYQTQRQSRKPAKLALIAVARKILVTVNAMLRDNTAFQP